MSLLPLEEAQARLLALAEPLGSELVTTDKASGRYLAADCKALRTQPAADLSAMDGYAMTGGDETGPWQIVGETAAGHPHSGKLAKGQCVRISTGALLPAGAAAILLQENAIRDGAALSRADSDGPSPVHVRKEGFDFRQGEVLLARGTAIGPAQVALAMAAGHDSLPVGRLPSVAVIDSGTELCATPSAVLPHQVPATNGAMLAAMATPLCASVTRVGPVRDNLSALLDALESEGEADVIVTSGGASMGDHDLVRPALEEWGARLDFWRIAVRPGKPLMLARKGRQLILGLPGNPVSSYVTGYLFLLPLLRRLAGAGQPFPKPYAFPLIGDLGPTGERAEFVRGSLSGEGVQPIAERDSSALRALSGANCLIHRVAGSAGATPGTPVSVYLLQNGGIA